MAFHRITKTKTNGKTIKTIDHNENGEDVETNEEKIEYFPTKEHFRKERSVSSKIKPHPNSLKINIKMFQQIWNKFECLNYYAKENFDLGKFIN